MHGKTFQKLTRHQLDTHCECLLKQKYFHLVSISWFLVTNSVKDVADFSTNVAFCKFGLLERLLSYLCLFCEILFYIVGALINRIPENAFRVQEKCMKIGSVSQSVLHSNSASAVLTKNPFHTIVQRNMQRERSSCDWDPFCVKYLLKNTAAQHALVWKGLWHLSVVQLSFTPKQLLLSGQTSVEMKLCYEKENAHYFWRMTVISSSSTSGSVVCRGTSRKASLFVQKQQRSTHFFFFVSHISFLPWGKFFFF